MRARKERPTTPPHAHFWTQYPTGDLTDWNPDVDPTKFESGYGHSFLEVYARLRDEGEITVTVGRRIPSSAGVVVASLEELSEWHRFGRPKIVLSLCLAAFARAPSLVIVRNDVHPHIHAPLGTTLEIMPTKAAVKNPATQVAVLPLPQRGISPRSKCRGNRISTVALKVYAENLPEWAGELGSKLAEVDVHLRVDTPGSEHHWSDFHDVDATLCIHPDRDLSDISRKPPTKLINAWAAATVPLCSSSPGYSELASDGVDAIFISDSASIVKAVQELNRDEEIIAQLLSISRQRSLQFTHSAVTSQWRKALVGLPRSSRVALLAEVGIRVAQVAFGPRVVRIARRAPHTLRN